MSSVPHPGPAGLRFGARAVRADQPRILRDALAALRPGRATAVFDLDSTLLDNKARQARIVREFGAARGDARLAACGPAAIVSWDYRDTLRLLGLPEGEAEAAYAPLKEFWRARFFTSDYCAGDVAVPGARDYLARVLAAGGRVLYVTGRHAGMGPGTVESFRRAGFPLPGEGPTELWLKPEESEDDDAWKRRCIERLRATGEVGAAFDNEPTHVNGYKASFPEAAVVHLDTDHSGRPVAVHPSIPSVADLRLELA